MRDYAVMQSSVSVVKDEFAVVTAVFENPSGRVVTIDQRNLRCRIKCNTRRSILYPPHL